MKGQGRFLKKAWQKLYGYGFFCFKNKCYQLVIKNHKSFGKGLENPFFKKGFSRNKTRNIKRSHPDPELKFPVKMEYHHPLED